MTSPVKEVAAAVIVTDGQVWLIKYEDQEGRRWPWQLINYRHDGKDPVEVIRRYVSEAYEVKIIEATLIGSETVVNQQTHSPMMTVTGVSVALAPDQIPTPIEGITLKQVDPANLSDYSVPWVYRRFIDQILKGDKS